MAELMKRRWEFQGVNFHCAAVCTTIDSVWFDSFSQMTAVKRAGMEKIIEDMAGHREEVEGDMTWMEEVICLDIGK